MPKFPHLMPNEVPIWEKFLAIWGNEFTDFRYDVRVGKGVDPGPKYDPKWRQLAIQLTQKRIDAVARKGNVIWIFEVKPEAGLGALGQLLSYRVLYRQTFDYHGPLKLAVVTTKLNEDERTVYRKYRIHMFEVGYV